MIDWLRKMLGPATPPASLRRQLRPPHEPMPLPPPTDEEIAILHRFVALPDLKQRREAVMRLLQARVHEVATAAGFMLKDKAWIKPLPCGLASANIRRFPNREMATVQVGFRPNPGHEPRDRSDGELSTQLLNFFRPGEGRHFNSGMIHLALVDHDPSELDAPMQVLRERALPWALAHADGSYPEIWMFADGIRTGS